MASEEKPIEARVTLEDNTVDEVEMGMKHELPENNGTEESGSESVKADNNGIEESSSDYIPSTSIDNEAGNICCELCGVTFTSVVYRDDHRRLCRGQRRVPQLVEPLSVPTDIQDLATLVDGKKIYCCSLCVYTTPRGGHMTRHLLSHMGARPFICIFCGKGFTQGAGLAHHIRIHSGDKPYRCDECDFACGRAIALKRHKNTHTREVMFACTHCDYATSQTYNLKVHLRTHSGERPYKCAQCDYRAGSTCAMRKHERNKHTPKLLCASCPRKFLTQDKLDKHVLKKHSNIDVKKKRKRIRIRKGDTKLKKVARRKKQITPPYENSDTVTDEGNVSPIVPQDNSDLITSIPDENQRVTSYSTDCVKSSVNEPVALENSVVDSADVSMTVAADNADTSTPDQDNPNDMDVSPNS